MDFYYEVFPKYTYPNIDCSGKGFIVTSSNIGIGKEPVRHFVGLGASRVIIAVSKVTRTVIRSEVLSLEFLG